MDTKTPTISEILSSYGLRVGVYAVITCMVFEVVYVATQTYGAKVMGAENGPIEVAQVVLALIGAAGLFYASCCAKIGRAGLVMCGAVVAYAAARESDSIFEAYLFNDAYKWLVGLPMLILVAVVVAAERHRLVADVMWLMRHPAATLFGVAGIFLCFVCQILDRPDMWVAISDAGEVEVIKALMEEYAELFAYLLLAFSGFEATVLARRGRAIAEQADGELDESEIFRIAA